MLRFRVITLLTIILLLFLVGCSKQDEQDISNADESVSGMDIDKGLDAMSGTDDTEHNNNRIPGAQRGSTVTVDGRLVTMDLFETDEAFPNPMKGFRPTRYIGQQLESKIYTTVFKHYIKYTDLEETSADTAQKIIDWSDKAWARLPERNIKAIPRVVIWYPNGPDNGSHGYWAEGIPVEDRVGRWLSDELKERLTAFIHKLGEAWDNDPRVAAIEIGLWGSWGEHHIWPLSFPDSYDDRIPPEIQQVIGDACLFAFPNTKLMVRYPETFLDYNFGFYWDSFALPDNADCGNRIIERNLWRTQMISGETAYDWGDRSLLGRSPNETLSRNESTDYVIDWIKNTGASSLGWISDYSGNDPVIRDNAARMQKALGYRFVITSAMYPMTVQPGGKLPVSLTVVNTGSAPFYYKWPVQVSLMDENRDIVYSDFIHVDIRNWTPGRTYKIFDTFTVPENLAQGEYIIALAILDPAGFVPSLRFANMNYYYGGYTPLGKIGIGVEPESFELFNFDSLYFDDSLYYTLEQGDFEIEDRQVYDREPRAVRVETSVHLPGNLAYKKPITVSSTETQYDNYDHKINDGDPNTRWSSAWGNDLEWVVIDLRAEYIISTVRLLWEWSRASAYEIQVSNDGNKWTTVYSIDKGKEVVTGNITEEITFDPVAATYVRLYMTRRALEWGYSIFEIEIYE